MNNQLIYQIAIGNLSGIGIQKVKTIARTLDSLEQFFSLPTKELADIFKISFSHIADWNFNKVLEQAERELNYAEQNNIQVTSCFDHYYPRRLKECIDGPSVLFAKGNMDLNPKHAVAIVGTRKMTAYGKRICRDIIEQLKHYDCTVVSGLAYGVDVEIHKNCLEFDVSTVGVLAHGLDRMYPQAHAGIAKKMLDKGGLLTEFPTQTNPDRENFPKRNRIVAGIVDAVIVVESGDKGGSLITCELANDYNRDVFAFPGDIYSTYSKGCNKLIKNNQAIGVSSVTDLIQFLDWNAKKPSNVQKHLFESLTDGEQKVVQLLQLNNHTIDQLSIKLNKSISELSMQLFELELKGAVRSLPGNTYSCD